MSLLTILHYPDPRLHQRAGPVERIDSELQRTFDDMFATMYAAPGIGLAATQVGIGLRFTVVDVSEAKNEPQVFVNPGIITRTGTCKSEEGCLSVPGYSDTVMRSEQVCVRALNRAGEPFELEVEGLLAVCIQHEIDHLDGRLFIDRLSDLKRRRARRQIKRAQREAQRDKIGEV